jgi:hypothetical protein
MVCSFSRWGQFLQSFLMMVVLLLLLYVNEFLCLRIKQCVTLAGFLVVRISLG